SSAEPAKPTGEHKILFCYELLANTSRLMKKYRKLSEQGAEAGALADADWTFYHELGHALIDIHDLPAVGREEDAVDQLATLVMLLDDEPGEAKALTTALGFRFSGHESQEAKHPIFWDEHSLNHQRYF